MKEYKVAVLKIGSVLIHAEDAQEMKKKVQQLSMDEIYWLSKEEGTLENYLITGIEEHGEVQKRESFMFEQLKEQWDNILFHVKEELDMSNVSFKTWLRPLKVCAVDEKTIKIAVPHLQALRYVQDKYEAILRASIVAITGFEYTLDFIVE